jgi:hypothetical protein
VSDPSPLELPLGDTYLPTRTLLGSITVTTEVPLFPSLVAVIVVEPTTTPLTRPFVDTGPTPMTLLDHVTARPVSRLPAESLVTAVSWTVDPMFTLAGDGVTVTVETGTIVTVMVEVPPCPSLVAVIVADPAATAETRPPLETVATLVALLDQVMVRPVRTLPAASFVVAVSCALVPMRSSLVAGATVTVATGTAVTVIALVPLVPSLVAVIVAEPAPTAVTRPLAETVATAAALLDQVTTRPGSTAPAASLAAAVSWVVDATRNVADGGVTSTLATGTTTTLIAELPLCPSLVAVMVADPAATALTRPLAETVATPAASLDQTMARPVRTFPAESLVMALSWTVPPAVTLADGGVTVTDFTGTGVTLIDALPDFPSLVAVIVADPAATAATTPLAETVATPGVLLDHVTVRPVSVLPAESLVVALSEALAPTRRFAVAGATVTVATGTSVTLIVALLDLPSLVAVIVADPVARPLTIPLAETVATAGALLLHASDRPVRTLPAESFVVALS